MIPIYLSGTSVTVEVPLVDRQGNPLQIASITYQVVDQDENVLVADTPLATFSTGSATASVTIDAASNTPPAIPAASSITNNQIGEFNTRAARTIILTCIDYQGNVAVVKSSYGLEAADPLIVGLNSFQTLPTAELIAMEIVGTPAWDAAANDDKIAAMIEARERICQLNFWLLNSNVNWGQDNLNYIPEGVYQSPFASDGQQMFIFNGNLSLLTPTQYNDLPYRFRNSLKRAQVVEADYLLGGNQSDLLRQSGVIAESIGQSRQTFRPTKALDLPVSKRALKYLSQFVTFSKRIGRG